MRMYGPVRCLTKAKGFLAGVALAWGLAADGASGGVLPAFDLPSCYNKRGRDVIEYVPPALFVCGCLLAPLVPYCSGTRSAMSSHMTGLEGSRPPVTAWMAV